MNRKEFVEISKKAFRKWQTNNATLRAAALTFFTVMPLPSLVFILVEIYALVYGHSQALAQLTNQIGVVVGPAVAGIFNQLLQSAVSPFSSIFGSFVSVAFALFGAIGAFTVLHDTLNVIWDVPEPKNMGLKDRIMHVIVPFFLVSGTAAVAIAWASITILLSSSLGFVLKPVIGSSAVFVLGATRLLSSFGLSVLLFAFIFNQVPDVVVSWGDVWLAAVISGLVGTALNYLFGVYLHFFPVTTIAGVAGSLLVLLLWIFIMNQFILFGAHFSNVYSETLGSHSQVASHINEIKEKKSSSIQAQS